MKALHDPLTLENWKLRRGFALIQRYRYVLPQEFQGFKKEIVGLRRPPEYATCSRLHFYSFLVHDSSVYLNC